MTIPFGAPPEPTMAQLESPEPEPDLRVEQLELELAWLRAAMDALQAFRSGDSPDRLHVPTFGPDPYVDLRRGPEPEEAIWREVREYVRLTTPHPVRAPAP